jgi:hypothetical protein
MNALLQAALELQNDLNNRKWPFCFIGGLAVMRWGEMRMTQDVDICLLCGFGNEESFIESLIEQYPSRVDDPVDFALRNRVLLLRLENGVPIDVSLSGLPFEEEMIRRSSPYPFGPSCSLITCSAEDLIVLKAFADRPKDWSDIEGIAMKSGNILDTPYIFEQLAPLCELKEAPEIVAKLKSIMPLV